MLQLTSEDIEDLKKDLKEGDQAELGKALDELKNYLTINQFTVNSAIDSKNYPSYSEVNADVEVNDPESDVNVKLAFQVTSTFSKINEKPEFVIGIPTDTITMDELENEMGTLGY
ncbi:hypothetical protein D3C81_1789610 [compost metagenome]